MKTPEQIEAAITALVEAANAPITGSRFYFAQKAKAIWDAREGGDAHAGISDLPGRDVTGACASQGTAPRRRMKGCGHNGCAHRYDHIEFTEQPLKDRCESHATGACEPVAAATEAPSAVGQFAYCNAEKGAWVCHRPKGHEGKHDSVGCATGCGMTWSDPKPSAPDDRERVLAAMDKAAREAEFGKRVADAIVPLLAEARAEGRTERLSATEEVLAKSRDLDRFLEREKARREMEGTVNERTYEPERLKASYVANPAHWRSRCEMLEAEVERLRKGAMQHAKDWMESAAEAIAQENENTRLRAERDALAATIARVNRICVEYGPPVNAVLRLPNASEYSRAKAEGMELILDEITAALFSVLRDGEA